MARRGRPPYPGLLTPREVEVLALLRKGLTNESIAERLGISLAGAKYHVSEILGKLGVETREEAAALWSDEGTRAHPWWAGIAAPIAFVWRRAGSGPVAAAGAATVALLIVAGIGLLVWGLLRTGGTNNNEVDLRATPRALVEIGGKIDSISDQQLVLRDREGHAVPIRLWHAEGPEAQFCTSKNRAVPFCMVLSEAAPTAGQRVCVLAHIVPPEQFVALFVNLDADCTNTPAQ